MPSRQKLSHIDSAEKVGRRLVEARRAAGLTQRELSFPGCTAAYISRIEQGERIPSLQVLREFARRLGVSESLLARGTQTTELSPLLAARTALGVGEVQEARELIDRSLEAATSDGERALASALYGEVALYESDAAAAIDALERALHLDPGIEARDPVVGDTLGRAYARANEYESAIGIFLRNFSEARKRDDLLNKIRFGSLLANAYGDTGNFARAEEVLGELIASSGDLSDPLSRARIYWAQSRMHSLKGDGEAAARYAERALELLQVSDENYYAALAHQLLAHIEIDRGNVDRAVELLNNAAPLVEQSGRPFERASLQLERARAMMKLGEHAQAASIAMGAGAVLEQASPHDAGRGYALIAKVFNELGDDDHAIELYELAIEKLQPISTRFLADAYSELAAIYEERGDTRQAVALLRRAVETQQPAPAPASKR